MLEGGWKESVSLDLGLIGLHQVFEDERWVFEKIQSLALASTLKGLLVNGVEAAFAFLLHQASALKSLLPPAVFF